MEAVVDVVPEAASEPAAVVEAVPLRPRRTATDPRTPSSCRSPQTRPRAGAMPSQAKTRLRTSGQPDREQAPVPGALLPLQPPPPPPLLLLLLPRPRPTRRKLPLLLPPPPRPPPRPLLHLRSPHRLPRSPRHGRACCGARPHPSPLPPSPRKLPLPNPPKRLSPCLRPNLLPPSLKPRLPHRRRSLPLSRNSSSLSP